MRIDKNCQLVQGDIISDRKEDHDAFLYLSFGPITGLPGVSVYPLFRNIRTHSFLGGVPYNNSILL